jgi:hypothetical protein
VCSPWVARRRQAGCTCQPVAIHRSPDKVRELVNLWFAEAGANQAFPLDDRSAFEIFMTPRPLLTPGAQPVHLLPRSGRRPRIAGCQRPQPLLCDRRAGRHPHTRRPRRPVRPRGAVRRARALHQGQPAPLCLRLRRQPRTEGGRQRRHPDRREPDPVGLVRQARRGPARRGARNPVAVPRRQESRRGRHQDPARQVRDRRRRTLHRDATAAPA